MGSSFAGGRETSRQPDDSLNGARQAFDRAAAEFVASPHRRWNLEASLRQQSLCTMGD